MIDLINLVPNFEEVDNFSIKFRLLPTPYNAGENYTVPFTRCRVENDDVRYVGHPPNFDERIKLKELIRSLQTTFGVHVDLTSLTVKVGHLVQIVEFPLKPELEGTLLLIDCDNLCTFNGSYVQRNVCEGGIKNLTRFITQAFKICPNKFNGRPNKKTTRASCTHFGGLSPVIEAGYFGKEIDGNANMSDELYYRLTDDEAPISEFSKTNIKSMNLITAMFCRKEWNFISNADMVSMLEGITKKYENAE